MGFVFKNPGISKSEDLDMSNFFNSRDTTQNRAGKIV